MTETAPVSVLIVDSQRLFRFGLARLLWEDPRISVAGVSDGSDDLTDLCASQGIDVVVTELQGVSFDAIGLVGELSAVSPRTRVLILASHVDWRVVPAISAGAAGFLLKDASPEAIATAVVSVHLGERVLCREAAQWLARDASEHRLTARERDILHLLRQGATNKEIAELLHLGRKTVRNYVSRLLRKLAVDNRAHLGRAPTPSHVIPAHSHHDGGASVQMAAPVNEAI